MAIDIGKVIGTSFRYAFSINRILPYFVINLFILAGIVILFTSAVGMVQTMQMGNQGLVYIGRFLSAFILFVISIVIISLAKLLVDASIADNSRKFWAGKDRFLSSSYPLAKKKYLSTLGAVIITGIITFLLSLIPFVGWLVSMIVGIMLLFVIQAVVIGNKNATVALSESYGVFRKNTINTIIFWILAFFIVIGFLIMALIPVGIAALPVIMQLVGTNGDMMSAIPLIQQNMTGIVAGGIIGCVIFAYALAVYQSALTFFYISARSSRRK